MVCRRVGGSVRGSKKLGGIKGGCSKDRGSRFKGRLRVGVPYRSVFASITLLVNRTKT